jgi:hypothetical protein
MLTNHIATGLCLLLVLSPLVTILLNLMYLMFPPIYTISLFSQYCKYCKFHRAINFVVDLMVVYFDLDSFHHKVQYINT